MNASEELLAWSKALRSEAHFWVQSVMIPVVVVIGVLGNLVTVVVLTRRRMTCSTNTYLTALAISDLGLLLCYLFLTFENHSVLKSSDYLLYWQFWRYVIWFTDASNGVSIWLTVSFTVERYIAVCHPLRGRVLCTESRARRVIVFFFVACFLVTATTPFEWELRLVPPADNSTAAVFVHKEPTSLAKNETYKTAFYWFWAITFVFIPLIILIILNSFLINAVHKSKRHRSNLTQCQRRMRGALQREQQENKMTMTLVAVVFLFLVCQTPTAVTLIVKIFYSPAPNTVGYNVMRALNTVWNSLVAVNAASNFFLYCVMSDKYRRTLLFTFFPALAGAEAGRRSTLASTRRSTPASATPGNSFRLPRSLSLGRS